MRTLFNLKPPVNYGVLQSAQWPYVRDGLRRNLEVILRYHRRNPQSVQSSHLLVRLLMTMGVPHSLHLDRFFENVDARTFNTASALNLTSSVSKGQLFDGVFYGPGNSEIIIAHNDYFDYVDADRNWRNMQPVQVVRHPRSDLMMNLPDGKNTGSETGLAVITINVPMLAVMYRAFSNFEQAAADADGGERLTIYHFLRMFVIPNMLPSHLDVALFNRIDNLQKGAPLGESKKAHSFVLPDYSKRTNAVQEEILSYIHKKRQDFLAVLKTIPAGFKHDMAEVMELPDTAPTRQVVWALSLARLPVLSFLFRAGRERTNTMNQSEINAIRRALIAYKADSTFESMLPVDLYVDTAFELEEIYDHAFG